jgi:hypothetical protein
MRLTQLKAQPVVDLSMASKRGIADVLVDATTTRVAAIDVAASQAKAHRRRSRVATKRNFISSSEAAVRLR